MRVLVFACVLALCTVVLSQGVLAEIQPKSVDTSTVRITKSGTLTPSGSIQSATLTLYVAQEGLQEVSVTPDDWEYATDASGNKVVRVHFKNFNGPQSYSLTQTVKTTAQRLYSETSIDGDSKYTAETSGAKITSGISSIAYPYERTIGGVAEMTRFVNSYMTYDKAMLGANRPSDWVLANKRGVCVEYSNLLTAMLRSKNIPARYASGYAYSPTDKLLIAHAWVEVLSGGKWVGFDPTWLEGGFIDATHVKTSLSLDGIEKETLTYLGSQSGNLEWEKNEDVAELVDYTTAKDTSISVEGPSTVPLVGGGYLKAVVTYQGCRIVDLTASSCTEKGGPMLSISDSPKSIWVCGTGEKYWAFTESLGSGFIYTCPVLVYDQSGNSFEKSIEIRDSASGTGPSITGPDSAGVNEPFTLSASGASVFFSPQLGSGSPDGWTNTIKVPGTYAFYAYSGGIIASKTVSVSSVREFELTAEAPALVNQSSSFEITVSVRNLGQSARAAKISASFGNQTGGQDLTIDGGAAVSLNFTFFAYEGGISAYRVSASSSSLTGYSGSIEVIPKPAGAGSFVDSIMGFFSWLMSLFGL